jgi:hypothetical protein
MEEDLLCRIIVVLLYKLRTSEIVLTQQDLEETLKSVNGDRLVIQGIDEEMRVGIYQEHNQPKRINEGNSLH